MTSSTSCLSEGKVRVPARWGRDAMLTFDLGGRNLVCIGPRWNLRLVHGEGVSFRCLDVAHELAQGIDA